MAGLGTNVGTEFTVRARMNGYTQLAGENVRLWFYALQGTNRGFMNDRFVPSVHLEVIEGELISVTFQNSSNDSHTIHWHGLDVDQANDGVESTSMAIAPFETFTYQFVAPHAGTYHYHCHFDTVVHYHRGMAGAVIVRPPGAETDVAWQGGPQFDEEVLWHLTTYDLAWETETVSSTSTARHRPNVFLLNGKEPGESETCPFTVVKMGLNKKAYVRVVNQAYQFARFSLGGLPFQIVATDGRPMPEPITTDNWVIGTGERYDIMFSSSVPYKNLATIEYLDEYNSSVLGTVSTMIDIRNEIEFKKLKAGN